VVLDRRIAERGRFPAVDILKSVSRAATGLLTASEYETVRIARALAAEYEDIREMLKIGAYQCGANPATDQAIDFYGRFEAFLEQAEARSVSVAETFEMLAAILPASARSVDA
jgi:flagellum-specific ATP synthase